MQAVILAGGLSLRLGGVPKAGLLVEGTTLLARTVAAAAQAISAEAITAQASAGQSAAQQTSHSSAARGEACAPASIAVVGPQESIDGWLGALELGVRVVTAQEDPPFAGPAAGIAAGLAALPTGNDPGERVLVLACDMPAAAVLVQFLVAADSLEAQLFAPPRAVVAVDAGRLQPLAGIYPARQLRAAVDAARASQRLTNASVRSLIASVDIKECAVPAGTTADIDTWDDARSHGIAVPAAGRNEEPVGKPGRAAAGVDGKASNGV